ncbi:hypothetical protein GCM10025868_34160 [Angustibacter aerolatus]|uniref:Uncharacterized protein n=1 Tax=Angustibacter aerolatus TaxID=1162965 RepID=A0ABQ6JIU5_9ACTN|nr:hypothetical protein GCM10025868_34160 [Angustibacter aerolatus]
MQPDGRYRAATSLPGTARAAGGIAPEPEVAATEAAAGVQRTETVVLDLRTPTNRAAFDRAFVLAGAVAVPRPVALAQVPAKPTKQQTTRQKASKQKASKQKASKQQAARPLTPVRVDAGAASGAARALVARFAADAVVARVTTRTPGAASTTTTTTATTAGATTGSVPASGRQETTLTQARSQDLAVPGSRLADLSGCTA